MRAANRTIDDIAKAAGVSTATVSRVLNNAPHSVSAGTRRRVEAAIKKLSYTPNVFARGLMKASTDSVGIIVPFISNPYHTQIVDAIEKELSLHNIFVYLCCTYSEPKLEADYVERLSARRVDALVLVEGPSVNAPRGRRSPDEIPVPVIRVNEHRDTATEHHIVRCAQEPGLEEALRHLLASGRRRIALFRGERAYSFDLKERLFRSFLSANGLDPGAIQVVRIRPANTSDAVHEAASQIGELFASRHAPDAVLAGNDLIAHGVIQGALAAGVRIPDDLSVISVDNTIIAEISRPRLTSVDLRMQTLGELTAAAFLDLRSRDFKSDEPIRASIDSRLVIRESG
jgi:LacI family transcriptional regulator, galactose operon repressor